MSVFFSNLFHFVEMNHILLLKLVIINFMLILPVKNINNKYCEGKYIYATLMN